LEPLIVIWVTPAKAESGEIEFITGVAPIGEVGTLSNRVGAGSSLQPASKRVTRRIDKIILIKL
jgi:hypothetical protein